MLEAEAKEKILALRPACPRGFNITGSDVVCDQNPVFNQHIDICTQTLCQQCSKVDVNVKIIT